MTTPRRQRFWCDTLLNVQLGSGAQSTPIDPLIDLEVSQTRKATIVRTLIDILIYPDGMVNGVSGAVTVDFGLGIASAEAAAANVHADPETQAEYPMKGWLFRTRRVVANQQDSGTAEMWSFPRIHEDLRSQRVVDRGEAFLVMTSLVSSGTGFTVRIAGIIRTLVLL